MPKLSANQKASFLSSLAVLALRQEEAKLLIRQKFVVDQFKSKEIVKNDYKTTIEHKLILKNIIIPL